MSAKMARKPPARISGNPIPSNGTFDRTVHRDSFSDKEPSPRGLRPDTINARAAVSFGPTAKLFLKSRLTQPTRRPNGNGLLIGFGITSERAADISDSTEPSEPGRRRADGPGQARRAEPVQ